MDQAGFPDHRIWNHAVDRLEFPQFDAAPKPINFETQMGAEKTIQLITRWNNSLTLAHSLSMLTIPSSPPTPLNPQLRPHASQKEPVFKKSLNLVVLSTANH